MVGIHKVAIGERKEEPRMGLSGAPWEAQRCRRRSVRIDCKAESGRGDSSPFSSVLEHSCPSACRGGAA